MKTIRKSKYTYSDHRRHIIDLIIENKFTSICEVGVDQGQLAKIVLQYALNKGLDLTDYSMVDPWRKYGGKGSGSLKLCKQVTWDTKYKRIHDIYVKNNPSQINFQVHRLTSSEAAPLFKDDSLDLVFIDADHTFEAVCQDIDLWYPKVRDGGILSGDDYGFYRGVKKAVDFKFKEVKGVKLEVKTFHNKRIWSVKK